jgi:2-hydroxy-6-oxonona-2,4-dienedioate hydrolase
MDLSAYRSAEERLWADAGALPTERFVRLRGLGVTVRVQEVGDGPPVLFIHGGPAAGSNWAHLAARLSGLRCLLVDRPGTGLSDPYRLTRSNARHFLQTIAVDVLDALGIERAHLVGSSTGSDCVLLAGAHHPERVDRTVHFGCPGLAPGIEVPLLWRLVALPGMWRLMAAMPASEKNVRTSFRQMGHGAALDAGRIPQALIDWALSLQRDTDTFRNEMSSTPALVSLRGVPKDVVIRREELASIQSPTYFLWGDRDQFGAPSVGRGMVDVMPSAELEVVPGGGHLVWFDDPDHAASVVTRHLLAVAATVPAASGSMGAGEVRLMPGTAAG